MIVASVWTQELNEWKSNLTNKHVLLSICCMSYTYIWHYRKRDWNGLSGKCLQLCLVYSKKFNKLYCCCYFHLREMHPSWGIIEQARISPGKGVEMQASRKKHPKCASLSKEWCPCRAQTGLSEFTVWKESRIVLFTHAYTEHSLPCGLRQWEQCILVCLAWLINGCRFSVGHSFSS